MKAAINRLAADSEVSLNGNMGWDWQLPDPPGPVPGQNGALPVNEKLSHLVISVLSDPR